jgi:hypothetical protein
MEYAQIKKAWKEGMIVEPVLYVPILCHCGKSATYLLSSLAALNVRRGGGATVMPDRAILPLLGNIVYC